MEPALWELLKTDGENDAEEVESIIRLDHPHREIAGVRIVHGLIATCRLRRDNESKKVETIILWWVAIRLRLESSRAGR